MSSLRRIEGTLGLFRQRAVFLHLLALFGFNAFVFHFDLSGMFRPWRPSACWWALNGVLSKPACRAALPFLIWLDCVYAWGLIPQNTVVPFVFQALVRALS